MKQTIALIGGTGKVGRHIAKKAIEEGFHVKMLIRDKTKISNFPSSTEIIIGNAFDNATLHQVIKNAHIVINTFGLPVRATPTYSQLTKEILSTMNTLGVPTYIGVTGGSLTLDDDKKTIFHRLGTSLFECFLSNFMEDKRAEFHALQSSDIDWTLVRLPFVTEGKPKKQVKVDVHKSVGMTITNEDIASFLLSICKERKFQCKTPFISN